MELHRYTVKEAIHDGNVLPFHVEYADTLREDSVNDYIQKHLDLDESDKDVYALSELEKESYLDETIYGNEEHMLAVIEQIINRSITKLGLDRGSGQSYSGILTVPSIARAQEYYNLFKRVLAGEDLGIKVHERVRKLFSDFPKIAITYSLS